MNSIWHRNTRSASRAFRLHSLPVLAHADGHAPELAVHARWNRTQPVLVAAPPRDKSLWLPLLAGLLAFGALAFGVFMAGSDRCTEREAGNYSQSTLAPIGTTDSGTAATGLRSGSCRHKPGRIGHPKTAP
ncbi:MULTISPECIES: hypothetical protein [unclassified Variovorax]|uniref:hypothetical protein n=1 Tax=unclassified Variovorax TaxID=663243 RepID=UPI000F7ED089|nr:MULTISPECIES: hypothetical protein [unclassified Variovorax]RSZ30163.1 hypothetical protein EJO70_32935 [Variovorax sp. 553]RSZ30716.1 hypothetical protein EJO71_33035 [Variovorax sp. 679]